MSEFANIEDKIEHLSKKIDVLIELINNKPQAIGDWVPEMEARSLLGLKATSMWALRKQNLIRSSKIGGKIYYSVASISKLLEKNSK